MARFLGLVRVPASLNASIRASVQALTSGVSRGKPTFFKEKADFITGFEKVGISDVIAFIACGEFGHGMVGEGEIIEERVGFG